MGNKPAPEHPPPVRRQQVSTTSASAGRAVDRAQVLQHTEHRLAQKKPPSKKPAPHHIPPRSDPSDAPAPQPTHPTSAAVSEPANSSNAYSPTIDPTYAAEVSAPLRALLESLFDADHEIAKECLELLEKMSSAVLSDPTNPKFRRLKTSNPRLMQFVWQVDAAVAYLEFVGFTPPPDDDGDAYVLPPDASLDVLAIGRDVCAQVRDDLLRRATQALQQQRAAALAKPPVVDRDVLVFKAPKDNPSAARFDLPESFFEISQGDVRSAMEAFAKGRDERSPPPPLGVNCQGAATRQENRRQKALREGKLTKKNPIF
jgi:hypothetical protein